MKTEHISGTLAVQKNTLGLISTSKITMHKNKHKINLIVKKNTGKG